MHMSAMWALVSCHFIPHQITGNDKSQYDIDNPADNGKSGTVNDRQHTAHKILSIGKNHRKITVDKILDIVKIQIGMCNDKFINTINHIVIHGGGLFNQFKNTCSYLRNDKFQKQSNHADKNDIGNNQRNNSVQTDKLILKGSAKQNPVNVADQRIDKICNQKGDEEGREHIAHVGYVGFGILPVINKLKKEQTDTEGNNRINADCKILFVGLKTASVFHGGKGFLSRIRGLGKGIFFFVFHKYDLSVMNCLKTQRRHIL